MKIESYEDLYNKFKTVVLAGGIIRQILGVRWLSKHDILNGDLIQLQSDITARLKEVMEDGEYDSECTEMLLKIIVELRSRLLGVTELNYKDCGIE